MRKTEISACIYDNEPLDIAAHIFFKCHQWKEARTALDNKQQNMETDFLAP